MKPLLAKLSELQTQLSTFESECEAIDEQVNVLTNTLEALGATPNVDAVKDCAKWGAGRRRGSFKFELLNAVHLSAQPQTTREIANTIGLKLGLELSDQKVWRKLRSQTKDYLNLLEKKGQVVKLVTCMSNGGSVWQKP